MSRLVSHNDEVVTGSLCYGLRYSYCIFEDEADMATEEE